MLGMMQELLLGNVLSDASKERLLHRIDRPVRGGSTRANKFRTTLREPGDYGRPTLRRKQLLRPIEDILPDGRWRG